jgi:alpha-beta hydrolase superfamily lysophospholipase
MIVQGSKDKLVKPEGTVELFNEIACQDKQLILIKNAEHLIFEENQFTNEEVDLIVNWMKDHVKQAAD